ncbi:TPA: hypothetical protein QDB01_000367 [Burkholderia vietnamiensis]|nr:hypothetical protein [Burkholderia vietnamiensis]
MTTTDLQPEIDAVVALAKRLGFTMEIPGGALPGEPATLIDAHGDALDDDDAGEPLSACAHLYALLIDLRDGVITREQFEGFGGEVVRAIVAQADAHR